MGVKKGLADAIVKKVQEQRKLRAYHGTPHEVDKFSTSKIGTGEGAQAYGHGLYFTDSPDIAREYKTSLSDDSSPALRYKRKTDANFYERGTPEWKALSMIHNDGTRQAKKLARMYRKDLESGNPSVNEDFVKRYEDTVNNYKKGDIQKDTGNLYTVDLDVSPDDMLDWDSAIADDKAKGWVKEALNTMPTSEGKEFFRDRLIKNIDEYNNFNGRHLYETLSMFLEPDYLNYFLGQKGIKGIKYKAGQISGSPQGAPDATNFVIFDDALISIAEKNGIPFEQVTNLAKQKGVTNQQALQMLIPVGAVGAGMQSQQAEAGTLGLANKLKVADKKGKASPSKQGFEFSNSKSIGYKVMRVDDDGNLVSGADSRYSFSPDAETIEMGGQGVFINNNPQYVLDYYGGLADNEVLLKVEFDKNDIKFGDPHDVEPEIGVSKVRILERTPLTEGSLPKTENNTSQLGSADTDLLRKTAVGGTAAVASPIALSFIEKRKQRPNSWISRRFNEAASSVVEPAMTVGNMIANDMTLSAGALGTGFLHNLADGFQRQGWTGAEQFVRPEQTPREFYDNSKLPVFMPPTEAGQQGLETLGNVITETGEYWKDRPLGQVLNYGGEKLGQAEDYLTEKLGEKTVEPLKYLSNILF
jgi:hypothetical protein